MSGRRRLSWIILLTALVSVPLSVPAQQEGEALWVALPNNVYVVVGQSIALITGRPSTVSAENCAPGTPWPASAVLVDESHENAAQNTGLLVFRDTEPRIATRIRIVGGPTVCNGELRLYTGVVE